MKAICFNCGTLKEGPFLPCMGCQLAPVTDNDVAVSALLTNQTMSMSDLQETARSIQAGQKIVLPEDTRLSVLSSLGRTRQPPPRPRSPGLLAGRGAAFWTWMAGAAAAVLAFLIFHPWPNYQVAAIRDTVPAYQAFLDRFDGTDLAVMARNRIRLLREDDVWQTALASGKLPALRNYQRTYYDGKYLAEAEAKIRELADAEWPRIAASRSVPEIRDYLANYPETSKRSAAEARIRELHDDWEWVKAEDKLEHYRAFAARFPNHPEAAWLEKRIIDLEVKAIAAGEFGEMPKAEPVSLGGNEVNLVVENGTGYVLTVLYSGADSKRLVVPVGETGKATLKPGTYQVAASVSAADVSHYYGSDTMQGGEYSSRFYITTSYGGASFPISDMLPTRIGR